MAARKQSEEAKLVAFFRTPGGEAFGAQGDHDNLSPAETAIRALRQLSERAESAEQMLASTTGKTRLALVAAEREACAVAAETCVAAAQTPTWTACQSAIARVIRARGVQ